MLTSHLNVLTYICGILVILTHYPIGRIFGQRNLLTGAFVGVCISALFVAVLANIFASGILPYILCSLFILAPISLWLLWKSRASWSVLIVLLYFSMALVGLAFLYLNSPWEAFFNSDKTSLTYNGHYTYYASQSIEMLNADYGSRIRALNLFPKEWATYHFYNAATQAITQALLPYPTLFSYFVSQAVLGTMVLLTFVEAIFVREKTIVNKYLKASLFITIGLTVFYDSMRWNLSTSGTITVFAAIHFVLALFEGNKRAEILFGTLLAASAIRLLPVVGPILLFIVLRDFKSIYTVGVDEISNKIINYISQRYVIFCLLLGFTAYIVVTLLSGMPNQTTRLGDGLGKYAWVEQLTFHILLTFITNMFNANWLEYHEPPKMLFRVLSNPFFTYLFLLSAFVIAAVLTFKFQEKIRSFFKLVIKFYRRLTVQLPTWAKRGIIILFFAFFLLNIKFFVVSSFYVFAILIAYFILRESCSPKDIDFGFLVIGSSYALTYVYVSTGMNGITGPVALAIYDLFLWGLVLQIILQKWNYKKLSHGLISLFLVISFHGKVSSIFAYGPLLDVPLSDLTLHPRAYYVDHLGFLSKEALELAEGNEKKLEAYSAIFGARLRYLPGSNRNHINFSHVWTE